MSVAMQEATGERRIVTTAEMMELLEQGHTIRLPQVVRPAEEVLAHYGEADLEALAGAGDADNDVVGIEYVGQEEVQCISIVDERHLYITDDFVPTHNTSNIVFLKSTDDSMIDTLEKMSGKRHVVYRDSKTVTKDVTEVIKLGNVEGKVSYTMNTKEEPVISYNDMASLSPRQSIVFRAGDSPVWNRNEMILPMSWRLFRDDLHHPGHKYTLMTIPTLSSALDFDVRNNQPDFQKMLAKRSAQAVRALPCKKKYADAYDLKDVDVARLDPDVYADEVMGLVDVFTREEVAAQYGITDSDAVSADMVQEYTPDFDWEEDATMQMEAAKRLAEQQQFQANIYAEGHVSRSMLVHPNGGAMERALDSEIVEAFKECRGEMGRDHRNFSVGGDGSLRSADGSKAYIVVQDESEAMHAMREAARQEGSRVHDETEDGELDEVMVSYLVKPEFYVWLASLRSWKDLASGEFDRAMAVSMRSREDATIE